MRFLIQSATAATMLVSTLSFAQEYVRPDEGFVSSKTRAEVIAELKQARVDHTLAISDHAYPGPVDLKLSRPRSEVVAELAQARASGELENVNSEYPAFVDAASNKTREQVRAELEQYRRSPLSQIEERLYAGGA